MIIFSIVKEYVKFRPVDNQHLVCSLQEHQLAKLQGLVGVRIKKRSGFMSEPRTERPIVPK